MTGVSGAAIIDSLRRLGLLRAQDTPELTPLSGGVSSDIWRVDLPAYEAHQSSGPSAAAAPSGTVTPSAAAAPSGTVIPPGPVTPPGPPHPLTVAAKQALPTLKVAAVWEAPVERSRFEAAWLETATRLVPGLAPALIGYDPTNGVVVMQWLDPSDHPVWKAQLRDGHADPAVAGALAGGLVRLHAATADDETVAATFASAHIFGPIRLEPYLDATARAHPDLASVLADVRALIEANSRVLVHGDVSPKNVLVGPRGPVLVDAECATVSDPAFDLAFCLNHLLLKCLWNPSARDGFLSCFDAFANAYLQGVRWEASALLEARAARILPAFLLARVDGKSPVEYLGQDEKAFVRTLAREMLLTPPGETLASVKERWHACLG